jgi:hypothetical protein
LTKGVKVDIGGPILHRKSALGKGMPAQHYVPPAPSHCIIRVNTETVFSADMTRYEAIVMFNEMVEEPHKYAEPGTIAVFTLHRYRNGGYFQERTSQLFVR